jgi:hypothetical protein
VPTAAPTVAHTSLNDLTGITNAGPDDIWASGYVVDGGANFRTPYVMHWTGDGWAAVTVPNAGTEGSQTSGIVLLGQSDVWTSGAAYFTDGGIVALTEHFNGNSWSKVPAVDPGQLAALPDNTFGAIAAAGPSTLFAVGSQETPVQVGIRPLAENLEASD